MELYVCNCGVNFIIEFGFEYEIEGHVMFDCLTMMCSILTLQELENTYCQRMSCLTV